MHFRIPIRNPSLLNNLSQVITYYFTVTCNLRNAHPYSSSITRIHQNLWKKTIEITFLTSHVDYLLPHLASNYFQQMTAIFNHFNFTLIHDEFDRISFTIFTKLSRACYVESFEFSLFFFKKTTKNLLTGYWNPIRKRVTFGVSNAQNTLHQCNAEFSARYTTSTRAKKIDMLLHYQNGRHISKTETWPKRR